MQPIDALLPNGWKAEADEETLTLRLPHESMASGAFLTTLFASGWKLAGVLGASVWEAGLALFTGLSFLGLLQLSRRESWTLELNSLVIRRSCFGIPWKKSAIHGDRLIIERDPAHGWNLRLGRDGELLTRCSNIEDAVRIGEQVSGRTGWTLSGMDEPKSLLREIARWAFKTRDLARLRLIVARDDAAPALVSLWRNFDGTTRNDFGEMLAEVVEPRTLLRAALADHAPDVQAAAIDLLAEWIDAETAPELRQKLGSADATVRLRAAVTLGRLGDPASVEPLCAALNYGGDLPLTAAWALGEIRDPRAVAALSDVLTSGERLAEGELRRTAAVALGRIGDKSAAAVLCSALLDPVAGVREGAAAALGRLCCPNAAPALRAVLADVEEGVVVQAIAALGALRDAAAAGPLGECLQHRSARVRAAALHSLAVIGTEASIPLLGAALRDRSADVRRAAAEALAVFAEACEDAPVRLRSATPLLMKLCARFSTERSDVKRACAIAITRIEQRTDSVKDLPLPAAWGEHSAATLPRAVEPENQPQQISLRRER